MQPTRSLRHNASVRSVASKSVSQRHQQSTSGGADKAYDAVLSTAAAKHAFELAIASSSVNETGYTRGGLNTGSSMSTGRRQERHAFPRRLSTRTGSYRRSVLSDTGLTRSKTVGPGSTFVPIGGKEDDNDSSTVGYGTLARSASAGANNFARARSFQSFKPGGYSRSAAITSPPCSPVSTGSTTAATSSLRKDSFLRGGDEFAEVGYRNNPHLRKKYEKKFAAAAKKAEKADRAEKTDNGSDRASNAFIKGVKKMFTFASLNAKNGRVQRKVSDEDERGTYSALTTTSEFTSPRSVIESHSPIPPQQVSSRQAYYRPVSQAGYTFSRRTSFAQSMRRVHVDDDEGSFDVNMPALGILKDKTNNNLQDPWIASRMSSYASTDPFLSAAVRETLSPPPLPTTQPLRRKSSLFRKPMMRQITPQRAYSSIIRRTQSRGTDTASQFSAVTASAEQTATQRQQHADARLSPFTQRTLSNLDGNQVAARQLSESSNASFDSSISSRDLRREDPAFSTIRLINTESRPTAASTFEHQHPATIPTENTNSQNPVARPDRLNRFFSTTSTGSLAASLPPPPTSTLTPVAVSPQSTGDTAASWANANPFRSRIRPQEISSLFPYYGVTRRATSTTASGTSRSRWHNWPDGNVHDCPQSIDIGDINSSEDAVIFRGGTASLSRFSGASDGRGGVSDHTAGVIDGTLRDSISDAVAMQFGPTW
ncbi:hypothetical protein V1517DRAFT_322958 [Lipomyces orientalis]|uniref:Uncharacterized protein n=1 Tax=Lipomyces orientalis TaxID=1233043 RepID=A0ACC3TR20_9ASCO